MTTDAAIDLTPRHAMPPPVRMRVAGHGLRFLVVLSCLGILTGAEHLIFDGAWHHGWQVSPEPVTAEHQGQTAWQLDPGSQYRLARPDGKPLSENAILAITMSGGVPRYGGLIVRLHDGSEQTSPPLILNPRADGAKHTRYLPIAAFASASFPTTRISHLSLLAEATWQGTPPHIIRLALGEIEDFLRAPEPLGVELVAYRGSKKPPVLAATGSEQSLGPGARMGSDRPEETWTVVPPVLRGAATARNDKKAQSGQRLFQVAIDRPRHDKQTRAEGPAHGGRRVGRIGYEPGFQP